MYIPELDALIFLATEFLKGGDNQPTLESGISSLHEAAGQQAVATCAHLTGRDDCVSC